MCQRLEVLERKNVFRDSIVKYDRPPRTTHSRGKTSPELAELVAAPARLTKARSPARPMIFSEEGAMAASRLGLVKNETEKQKKKKSARDDKEIVNLSVALTVTS